MLDDGACHFEISLQSFLPMILSTFLRSVSLTTLAMLLMCTVVNAQNDMRLFYNINSGNVQVEVINPMIELFSVETLGPVGGAGTGFLLANNVDSSTAVGAPISTPPPSQDTIAFLNTPNAFPVGTVDLGNILPPGITFVSTDATDTLSTGTDAAGNSLGFASLAFTVSGTLGSPGYFGQAALITVSTAVCGDINLDGDVSFLDIAPFIALLSSNTFQGEADCDQNGNVNFLDIAPFIDALTAN